MKRVTGIGGVFIKATDPQKLQDWYEKHLGLKAVHGAVIFDCPTEPEEISRAQTVWAIFGRDTKYFEPSRADFMINFRVENLTELIAQLRSEGVDVDERTEEYEHGKFGWIQDPEGNRIELWEPPAATNVDEASGAKQDES